MTVTIPTQCVVIDYVTHIYSFYETCSNTRESVAHKALRSQSSSFTEYTSPPSGARSDWRFR